jgi:hypothetical protein
MKDEFKKPVEKTSNDAPSFGFAFLSFFLPLIGAVLFGVWRNSKPQRAKSCANGAVIGFIANAAIALIPSVGPYSGILLVALCIIIAVCRIYQLHKNDKNFKFFKAGTIRFYPLIVIFSIIWILCMFNISLFVGEFISSGRFKNNTYYEYLWRMKDADFVLFISIGAVMVIVGCLFLIARRKNGIYVGLTGGIIKISGYLICGVFLEQHGRFGSNYGSVYLDMNDFLPALLSDMAPALIILLLLFIGRKKKSLPKEIPA